MIAALESGVLALALVAGELDAVLARGELLLGELGCTACHAASAEVLARLAPKRAPSLERVGARLHAGWMRDFVASPHALAPGTTMPDVLGALADEERALAASELAHYLASLGGPLAPEALAIRPDELDRGRRLYHSVGCVACHAPREPAADLAAPFWELAPPEAPRARGALALDGLDRKWNVDALARFLADPLALRPSGRMPSMRLDESEARAIAQYLVGESLCWSEEASAAVPGLEVEYWEGAFAGALPELDAREPLRRAVVADFAALPEHRPDGFALRFRGFLDVPSTGNVTFWTRSDDGSRLWIDGRLVVDNDGDHAPQDASGTVHLERGRHALAVAMYENAGGEELAVDWRVGGGARAPIGADALSHVALVLRPPESAALALDAELVARGALRFEALGCARCHPLEHAGRGGVVAATHVGALPREAPPLDELDPDHAGARGCLGDASAPGSARYALSAEDRAALAAALRARASLASPLTGEARVRATLARLACTACHARAGAGGPDAERRAYFATVGGAELGDEGRLPPELDGVGAKLREPWLRAVLLEGASARPYMATRMPDFGAANVEHLVALFPAVDGAPAEEPAAFSLEAVEAGRTLVGTEGGLGCIQCHAFAGHRSLGVPAVDLADVGARLHRAWFARLLADPASLNQLTRMPLFWIDGRSPVRDVCDGEPARQIDAIWTYLSLGHAAPLPAGLVIDASEHEIVPADRPRMVGVFFEGASPRTIAVGNPENVHYAFDVLGSRLACAWRGRFLDASGTWVGRAGALERPPSDDRTDLPGGVPLALLASEDAAWPAAEDARELGYRVLGRGYDAERRPVFRYALDDVTIEETPRPALLARGGALVRDFRVLAPQPHERLWMRAAVGAEIVASDGAWVCDGEQVLVVHGSPDVRVRRSGGASELLVRVGDWAESADGSAHEARFGVEVSW